MRDALRLRAKHLRRQVKHWQALRTADVAFLSPAKSGRTWLRAMLSQVYHLSYGTPADELVSRDRFHRLEPRIPRLFFSHEDNEPLLLQRRLTPQGLRDKTVICLVRDPRDIVVSFFHQHRHRKTQMDGAPAAMTDDYLRSTLASVIAKVNRLQALAAALRDGHLFRYEDLHAAPEAELARLLRVLGHDDVPWQRIEAAVAFAAFDNLKEREATGFFRGDNLRPADATEPNSFKVRRGKVGGHRDELSAAQVLMLDRMIDATVAPGLGYRTGEPAPPAAVAPPARVRPARPSPARGATSWVPGLAVDRRWFVGAAAAAGLIVTTSTGFSDEAVVVDVEAVPEAGSTWQFSVTVRHADEGWEHYADKWQVLGPDGTVLGERVLLHPHVDEQPFTRSLGGVTIPEDVEVVEVRAHDTVDGWGPAVAYDLRPD